MLNFSTKSLSEKYLSRSFPPCNCTQCKLLRAGNNPDQHVNNLCAKIARAYQSDRNEEEKNNDLKSNSKLHFQLEVETEDIMDCVREIGQSKLKETEQSASKASMEHEQSSGDAEEAKSKQDITELSNESIEQAKPQQSNESLKKAIPDTIEQLDGSLQKVNAAEIGITSADKVSGKMERHGIRIRSIFKVSNLNMPSFNFKPDNLQYFLLEIVGVVAFFSMSTAIFWVTILQSLWHFIKVILSSGKKAQLATLILFLLLCATITLHALRGGNNLRVQQNTPTATANEPPERPPIKSPSKCHQKCCEHIRNNLVNAQNSNKNILAPTDSSSSLYSVSNEIITPPFVECADETITGIFNRITRSIASFFSRYIHHM